MIIPRIITIIFFANSIKNKIPMKAKKHHQKLNPVMYDARTIIISPRIHRIGELLNILFITGRLKV